MWARTKVLCSILMTVLLAVPMVAAAGEMDRTRLPIADPEWPSMTGLDTGNASPSFPFKEKSHPQFSGGIIKEYSIRYPGYPWVCPHHTAMNQQDPGKYTKKQSCTVPTDP